MYSYVPGYFTTVETNVKRKDCRLLHSGISISKKEQSRKLFHFNLVTTVDCYLKSVKILSNVMKSTLFYDRSSLLGKWFLIGLMTTSS